MPSEFFSSMSESSFREAPFFIRAFPRVENMSLLAKFLVYASITAFCPDSCTREASMPVACESICAHRSACFLLLRYWALETSRVILVPVFL